MNDRDRLKSEENITGNKAAIRFWIAVAGVVSLIAGFYKLGGPKELTGPPATLTIHAELSPSQESETIEVRILKQGGFKWLHDRALTSGTLKLSQTNRSGTLKLSLPGSGPISYVVQSRTKLNLKGNTIIGETVEREQVLTVNGSTDLYYRKDAAGQIVARAGGESHFTYQGFLADHNSGMDDFGNMEPPCTIVVQAQLAQAMLNETISIRLGEQNQYGKTLNLTTTQRMGEAQFTLPKPGTYPFTMTGSSTVQLPGPQGQRRTARLQAQGTLIVEPNARYQYIRIADFSTQVYSAKLRKE